MAHARKLGHWKFHHRCSLMSKKGYHCRRAAENCASNGNRLNPAKAAVFQWLNSNGHRRNMWTQRGIQVQAAANYVMHGRNFVTQMFVRVGGGYNKDDSGQTEKYGPKEDDVIHIDKKLVRR